MSIVILSLIKIQFNWVTNSEPKQFTEMNAASYQHLRQQTVAVAAPNNTNDNKNHDHEEHDYHDDHGDNDNHDNHGDLEAEKSSKMNN